MKSLLSALAIVAFATLAPPAMAQAGHDHAHGAPAKDGTADATYTGEVKRVNQDTRKITISHGPLTAFDMPPMTMAFGVKEAALLGKVRPGDKVKFGLEKAGDDLVITRIEAAR